MVKNYIMIIRKKKKKNVNNSNEKEENFIEELYYTDIANSVIYRSTNHETIPLCIKEYQGNPFKAVNNEDNSIFFCDSGYFESISLNNPLGSIFKMDLETNEIAPILLNCLEFPSDIYFDNILQVGYIAETFNNRILRMVKNS